MNPFVHNLFEDNPSDRFRSIEGNVVHYNPEWRFSDASGEHRKYLLPSRKFLRMPKPVLPADPRDRITENFVPNVTDGTTVDIAAELRRNLFSCKKTEILLSPNPGSAPVKVTSLRAPGTGLIIDDKNAQGWHYLDSYALVHTRGPQLGSVRLLSVRLDFARRLWSFLSHMSFEIFDITAVDTGGATAGSTAFTRTFSTPS